MKYLKYVPVLLFLFLAAPAFAADSEVMNTDTGANSSNNASVYFEDIRTVKNVNEGKVQNEVKADIVSGGNEASFNTGGDVDDSPATAEESQGIGGGNITTGDASFDVQITNDLNRNKTTLALSDQKPEEEGGIGGGPDEAIEAAASATLAAAETLPSAGADPFSQLGMLLTLPLLGVLVIRFLEKSKKSINI